MSNPKENLIEIAAVQQRLLGLHTVSVRTQRLALKNQFRALSLDAVISGPGACLLCLARNVI